MRGVNIRSYLDCPVISIQRDAYLTLIVILAPVLNFLSGINIDIQSPAMPAMGLYFHASMASVKNTVSVTVFGWMIGVMFFGVLLDRVGRKPTLVYGLLIYIIVSCFGPWCSSIYQLLLVRFIQGFTIATISVGCRALIIDYMSGRRYAIVMLYASIGYGLGPLVGPFIGSILQHHFGWFGCFYLLAGLASVLLIILVIFLEESMPQRQACSYRDVVAVATSILKNRQLVAGIMIAGIIQIQLMLYPTIGPFIVQEYLHNSVLLYGRTALAVGGSYLIGTLMSRLLLQHLSPRQVCDSGCVVMVVALVLSYVFTAIGQLNLVTVMVPTMLLCISAGLIFANVMGANLRLFSQHAGVAMAVQLSSFLSIAALGIFVISHVHVVCLRQLSIIFSVLVLSQIAIFYYGYRSIFD